MSNKLAFSLSNDLAGIAGYLSIQLLQDEEPVGTAIAVVESSTIPARYSGTMAGAVGFYKAVLLFENPPAAAFAIATLSTFYWDGANVLEAVDLFAQLPSNFADLAIAPTTGTVSLATTPATAADVAAARDAITAHTLPMAAQLGLVAGVTATHSDDAITVSSGPGSTTITDNGDGSYTVEGA
jgi:hypothetical protein